MKCWILIAYIPIPVFKEKPELHTALQQRLFHQCLKIVLESLKTTGKEGETFRDSYGDQRICYPRIAAYLADYPEQILINCAAAYNSPVTTAKFHGLGDAKPHARRTKNWIMSRIADACRVANPEDIAMYLEASKTFGLNAVDQPFWEDFEGYEPDLVICPDILHGLFRFWRDHILKWIQNLVGNKELDLRVKALQPITGIRHFKHGISHLSQWTGREDRELQRIILAVIAGVPTINERAMRSLRAFHDFLYLAQYRSHSTTTLRYLDQALATFHSTKSVFISNGARRGKKKTRVIPHFNIPKMAGLHMYSYHIPRMGTSIQFSTEITETCHQTMTKAPYKATNCREFFVQMCEYLIRQDTLSLTADLGWWYFTRSGPPPMQRTPDYSLFIRKMIELTKKEERLEMRNKTRAKNNYMWLTVKADRTGVSLDTISKEYQLRGFSVAFVTFLRQETVEPVPRHTGFNVDVWYRFRIQRTLIQDEEELADPQTIQAVPHVVHKKRHGLHNCVLIKVDEDAEDVGIQGNLLSKSYQQLTASNRLSYSSSPLNFSVEGITIPSSVRNSLGICLLVFRASDQRYASEHVPCAVSPQA